MDHNKTAIYPGIENEIIDDEMLEKFSVSSEDTEDVIVEETTKDKEKYEDDDRDTIVLLNAILKQGYTINDNITKLFGILRYIRANLIKNKDKGISIHKINSSTYRIKGGASKYGLIVGRHGQNLHQIEREFKVIIIVPEMELKKEFPNIIITNNSENKNINYTYQAAYFIRNILKGY